MFLAQRVERFQRSSIFDVPERPAVARWSILQRGSDLVDGTRMGAAGYRAVRTHRRGPATLRIDQHSARRDEPTFDEQAKGDAGLLALVENRPHCALVERERRIDALASDLHISALALDPDPAPSEAPCDRPGRAGSEKWI